MLHNTPVKNPAWMTALIACAAIHGLLLIPLVPTLARVLAARQNLPLAGGALQIYMGFAIGWCVVVSIWCAMVTNVLAKEDNRWGGLKGAQLVKVVVGLTLALNIVNSPCLWTCPATALVIPILSYVAISNNSVPFEQSEEDKSEPTAHG